MIITSIILAIIALVIFNKTPLKKKVFSTYSAVKKGIFEITVSNSDAKMFEVQIRVNVSDPSLGPSMATGNKIII